jgi:hypothetical protein
MPTPKAPAKTSTDSASPLARTLAAQSAAVLTDLEHARGLDASTFATLADRARWLADTVAAWDAPDNAPDPIRAHAATLDAVARLIDDPTAGAIPPSNDRIYGAVLDITELDAIVRTLGSKTAGRSAIHRHLTTTYTDTTDAGTARADRLTLAFAAVCKRGGLGITLPEDTGGPAGLDIDGWRAACAPAVPLDDSQFEHAIRDADAALRARKRPGLIILEAGPLLDWKPIRVAEDRVAISIMHDRLDAYMVTRTPARRTCRRPRSGARGGTCARGSGACAPS